MGRLCGRDCEAEEKFQIKASFIRGFFLSRRFPQNLSSEPGIMVVNSRD